MSIDEENLKNEILAGVQEVRSSKDWTAFLEKKAQLPNYSWGNVFLILRQYPEASFVAGYTTWKKVGNPVRKGERGISITAPYIKKDEETGEKIISGFGKATVFDISQTVQGIDWLGMPDRKLKGSAPELLEKLKSLITDNDIKLIERVIPDPACNGRTYVLNTGERVIEVQESLEDVMKIKTLLHEMTHAVLHQNIEDYAIHRGAAEVEAESGAFVLGKMLGIDTGSYTFNYINAWLESVDENIDDAIQNALKNVDVAVKIWGEKISEKFGVEFSLSKTLEKKIQHQPSPSIQSEVDRINL